MTPHSSNALPIYQRPAELLQALVRCDTTNPPGNEEACVSYLREVLTEAGIPCTLLARTPGRPNLVARLPGSGEAPPFLMHGHVDVVSTAHQEWERPPFGGEIVDGWLWGRGALDMKGGVAMMVAALLRAQAEGATLPGSVVLAIVCDEEAGGHDGARYLVENHAEQFEGVRYAIGEAGAFGMHIGGKCLYPIMVSEKQACPMRVTMRGQGGHGSMPVRGGAMAKLAHLLRQLDRHRLPVHVTPAARLMFTATADALGGVSGALMRQFTRPLLVDGVLNLMGERGRIFDALLHNTVSATVVQASDKINVIPAKVTVELDGRLLPGFGPEDMLAELRHLVGADVEIEVLSFDPYPPEPDMGLYGLLADAMRTADPAGIPVPFMASGVTDGRHFARLGIQTYGFLPTPLPPGCNLAELIHAANERIPVESVSFGADVIYDVLQRPKR